MASMRVSQSRTIGHFLNTRSAILRQTIRQLEQVSSQPLRSRPVQQNIQGTRSFHQTTSQRTSSNPTSYTQSFTFRSSARRAPHPHFRTNNQNKNGGRRWNSSSSSSSTAEEEKLSLSQRLKKLSREYGWSALGVYLLLTAADFPFCFMAVRLLGTDRIGHWEHVVLETVKGWLKWPLPEVAQGKIEAAGDLVEEAVRVDGAKAAEKSSEATGKRILEDEVEDHGYKEAEAANSGANASIWTQLALAYAIHKSFIFIRVPLTVSITPKVVKTLRSWGWNIGKVPSRKGIQGSTSSSGSATGVNTKGSKVKPDD